MWFAPDWRVWIEIAILAAICFHLCRKFLPTWVAAVCVVARFGLSAAYFTWFFRFLWVGGDGLRYYYGGRTLLGMGYGPISVLTTGSGLRQLHIIATGNQIAVFWLDLTLEYLFGAKFCVPVLFNVGASIVAAYCVYRIILRCGTPAKYASAVGGVLILHPEVVSYATFSNLKDVPVYALCAAIFYYLSILSERFKPREAIIVTALLGVQLFFRFYMPFLELAALGIWVLLYGTTRARWAVLPLGATVGAAAATQIGLAFYLTLYRGLINPKSAIYGWMHFLFTPRPYALPPWDSYLYVSAIVNWILFPLIPIGMVFLWRAAPGSRLLVIFYVLVVLSFGLDPYIPGYRERFQIYFVAIWAQCHAVWVASHVLTRGKVRRWLLAETAVR